MNSRGVCCCLDMVHIWDLTQLAQCCITCELLLTHCGFPLFVPTGKPHLDPAAETDLGAADSIWQQALWRFEHC